MTPEQSIETDESVPDLDRRTVVALTVALVIYPLAYSTDFFGRILFSFLPSEYFTMLIDESNRYEWWYFWCSNLVFHWLPFGLVAWALAKNGQTWSSIGLDWTFFVRHRVLFLLLFSSLTVGAFVAPSLHYGGDLPSASGTHFIGPISIVERLFMILGAVTAAVTEEVLFRGFPLTRLRRYASPWLILPVTVISFVLIHGEPRSVFQVMTYVVGALGFGVPFILMKLKRLEVLITVHLLIDIGLVIAP